MRYRILGPLEAIGEEGPLPLGAPKQRALLAVLLLHGGQPVSIAALVDEMWGEAPPRTAEHSIQTYVSGLRSILGAEAVVTTPGGYRFGANGSEVDAAAFERLAAEAARAELEDDPGTVHRLCGEALEMWSGRPLADVELATYAHPRAVRLSELRLQVAERWAEAALALSRPHEILADLERLTLENPLRESLWALRMRALDAAGRTPEALRVFQHLRQILGDEMGIEPSRELKDLEESFLLAESGDAPATPRNPYKGLLPFGESDTEDFFGRQPLVRELVEAVADRGRQMVSVVGPSGSGKSSVVRAGLVPRLRAGAIQGSESWTYVVTQPGADPFQELHSALVVAVGQPSAPLEDTLEDTLGLFDTRRRLLLVLDQFEEVFTLPDDTVASFLDLLANMCENPSIRLVATLRADFYDRPLLHRRFGQVFTTGVVHVHPLSAEELSSAAIGPAERVGVRLEPALASELLRDVAARPGSLPLFQYALTEVFDRRAGTSLTLAAYRAIGGVSGALIRRAEEVYERLSSSEQDAMRQIFFRLVTVGEGDQVTRRRVTLDELRSLGMAENDLERVLDRLGHHRLVAYDRNTITGEPAVEVAHEALLAEWPRLRTWLDTARHDLRRRNSLAAAREEWNREGQDPGFLLDGTRLSQYEQWARDSLVILTSTERAFLEASVEARARQLDELKQAQARQRGEVRRSRLSRWAVAFAVAAAVATPLWIGLRSTEPSIGVVAGPGGDLGIADLFGVGITRAEQRHGFEFTRVTPLIDAGEEVAEMCRSDVDLIVVGLGEAEVDFISPECDDSMIVFADVSVPNQMEDAPNIVQLVFLPEEASFLAGAAAALTTETKVVGFVGGVRGVVTPFLAGFQAGVASVDGETEVLAVWTDRFDDPLLGRTAADTLIAAGADVIYHAAGNTGDGVLAGVTAANQEGPRPVWFIGVDVDEWMTAPPVSRPYVLTSVLKRLDHAVSDTIDAFMAGDLRAGTYRYGLANQGVELTTTGGHIEELLPRIEQIEQQLVSEQISISPSEVSEVEVLPFASLTPTHHGTLLFAGGECRYEGPASLSDGEVLEITITDRETEAFVARMPEGVSFDTDPIPTDEPPQGLDPSAVRAAPESVTLPAIDGNWSVGCLTDEWVYPAAMVRVVPDD